MKYLNTILLGVLVIISAVILVLVIIQGDSGGNISPLSTQDRIEIANEYLNNELYKDAIEMYETVIFDESYDRNRRANMLYKVAELYKDELGDYKGALSSFLLMRKIFPDNSRTEDIERGIIECLDNLGRSAQAQSRLEKVVSLGQDVDDVPAQQIIAKIGDRAITQLDLQKWLNQMQPDIARQYNTPEKKFELLQMKVSDQLLYDAAIRAGYDKKENIQRRLADMKRQLLATAYYQDHVKEGFTATEEELKQFYQENKDKLFGNKKFTEVQDSVETLFSQHKLRQARMSLSKSLFEAEKVQFYPQNLGLENEN